jgi:uncharacterized membrane protein
VDAIQFVKTYFLALTLFFAFDMAWLGFVAKGFYQRQIGALLKENISWPAAFVFYALFVFGLVHFVITPGMEKRERSGRAIKWSSIRIGHLLRLRPYQFSNYQRLATDCHGGGFSLGSFPRSNRILAYL